VMALTYATMFKLFRDKVSVIRYVLLRYYGRPME